MWRRRFPKDGRDGDEEAAYTVAAWLQRADQNGSLGSYFNPPLTPEERVVAAIEGWILGARKPVNRDFMQLTNGEKLGLRFPASVCR